MEAVDLVSDVDDMDTHFLPHLGVDHGNGLSQLRCDSVEALLVEDLLQMVLAAGDAKAIHDEDREAVSLRLGANLSHEDHFVAYRGFIQGLDDDRTVQALVDVRADAAPAVGRVVMVEGESRLGEIELVGIAFARRDHRLRGNAR